MDLVLDLITTKACNKTSPAVGRGESHLAVTPLQHSCLVCAAERTAHRNADYIGLLQRRGVSRCCVLCDRNVT